LPRLQEPCASGRSCVSTGWAVSPAERATSARRDASCGCVELAARRDRRAMNHPRGRSDRTASGWSPRRTADPPCDGERSRNHGAAAIPFQPKIAHVGVIFDNARIFELRVRSPSCRSRSVSLGPGWRADRARAPPQDQTRPVATTKVRRRVVSRSVS